MTRMAFVLCSLGLVVFEFGCMAALGASPILLFLAGQVGLTLQGLGLTAALLILWLGWFPATRLMARSRLRKRQRPLWWADVPGAFAFGLIVLIGAAFFVRVAFGIQINETSLDLVFVIVFGAVGLLSLGTGIALFTECLRPDLPSSDDADVFD